MARSKRNALIGEIHDFARDQEHRSVLLKWTEPRAADRAFDFHIRAKRLVNWLVENMPMKAARKDWREIKSDHARNS